MVEEQGSSSRPRRVHDGRASMASRSTLADDIFQLRFGGADELCPTHRPPFDSSPRLVITAPSRMLLSCPPCADTLPVFVLNLKNRLLDQAEDELARLPHQTRLQKHRR